MPRDVATRWNSTYNMLKFAVEYQHVIDEMTADRKMKLRKVEMVQKEWELVA